MNGCQGDIVIVLHLTWDSETPRQLQEPMKRCGMVSTYSSVCFIFTTLRQWLDDANVCFKDPFPKFRDVLVIVWVNLSTQNKRQQFNQSRCTVDYFWCCQILLHWTHAFMHSTAARYKTNGKWNVKENQYLNKAFGQEIGTVKLICGCPW